MSRMPRMYVEGAVYYVTSRGDNSENIFKEKEDYEFYLNLIKKYKEQHKFKLFAFILLPNHLHLLFELKEGLTISQVLHDLNSSYIKYFNGKYSKKGHLFQERAKIVVAEKKNYLPLIISYIHLNPIKLGLAVNPGGYEFSSYLYYSGEQVKSVLLNLEEELKETKDYLPEKNYADFLAQVNVKEMQLLGEDLNKKNVLGSQEFLRAVELKMKETAAASVILPPAVNKWQKVFILTGSAAIIILIGFAFFLYRNTKDMSKELGKITAKKNIELAVRLNQEKVKISRDLDEKYRADLVSYQAMSKRLQIEKNRVKELEAKAGSK